MGWHFLAERLFEHEVTFSLRCKTPNGRCRRIERCLASRCSACWIRKTKEDTRSTATISSLKRGKEFIFYKKFHSKLIRTFNVKLITKQHKFLQQKSQPVLLLADSRKNIGWKNQIIPGTIWPVVMYAPTRAIRPTRANFPFKFSALIFWGSIFLDWFFIFH